MNLFTWFLHALWGWSTLCPAVVPTEHPLILFSTRAFYGLMPLMLPGNSLLKMVETFLLISVLSQGRLWIVLAAGNFHSLLHLKFLMWLCCFSTKGAPLPWHPSWGSFRLRYWGKHEASSPQSLGKFLSGTCHHNHYLSEVPCKRMELQ